MALEFEDADFDVSDWRIAYGYTSALEYDIDGEIAVVGCINASPGGCGIGRALCIKFEEIALAEGCKVAVVPSSLTDEAVGFWVAMGYDVENKEDRRRMRKILKGNYNADNDIQGVIVLAKKLI
jgi:hypothetical protein